MSDTDPDGRSFEFDISGDRPHRSVVDRQVVMLGRIALVNVPSFARKNRIEQNIESTREVRDP